MGEMQFYVLSKESLMIQLHKKVVVTAPNLIGTNKSLLFRSVSA